MENKKVISHDNLPVRIPIIQTLVAILALDHWHAADWVWAIIIIFLVMLWGYVINRLAKTIEVDIFKSKP